MILRVHFAGQFVNLETSLSILYEFALMSKKGFIGLDLFSAFKFSTNGAKFDLTGNSS